MKDVEFLINQVGFEVLVNLGITTKKLALKTY